MLFPIFSSEKPDKAMLNRNSSSFMIELSTMKTIKIFYGRLSVFVFQTEKLSKNEFKSFILFLPAVNRTNILKHVVNLVQGKT